MTDATINESVVGGQASDQDTLTTLVRMLAAGQQTLAAGQQKLENVLVAFSDTAMQVLTGVPHGQTAPAPAKALQPGAKRRGRPVGSKNRVKAEVKTAKPEPTPMTPVAVEAVGMIKKAGRLTQSELAEHFKMERSLIEHHMLTAIEHGQAVCLKVKRPGHHKQILYYRPDWVNIKGG